MTHQNALPGFNLAPQEQPLDKKIGLAIKIIQEYEKFALDLSENGYYVAFSGGKDSVVLKYLFNLSGVKFTAHYNQTTIDPPELVRFIQSHHKDVKWNRADMHMCTYMVEHEKGPPTRLNRWCCAEYKEKGGSGLFKAIGVRMSESIKRRNWKSIVLNNRGTGHVICPILYWTDADVWEFIKKENIPYCSLYDEGFIRLGCIACPMSGPKGLARDFEKWPRFKNLWQRAFMLYFEKCKNKPKKNGESNWLWRFNNWQEMWNWWISRKAWKSDECASNGLFDGGEHDDLL